MVKLIASLAIVFLTISNFSHALELQNFTKKLQNETAKISPDGKHIAIRTLHEGKKVLVFINTASKKVTFTLNMSGKESVGSFEWANDERVVIGVLSRFGALDNTYNTGRLFAINYDGRKPKAIFGSKAAADSGISKSKKITSGTAFLQSIYKQDDKKIIVGISPWRAGSHLDLLSTDIVKLDIYTGHQKKIMKSPGRGSGVLLDHNDEVRFAGGITGYDQNKVFYREADGEWSDFKSPVNKDDDINIHGFSADNEKIYFTNFHDGDTGTLYSYQLKTKKLNKIYKNDFVTFTNVLTNYKDVPYGVRIDEDYSNFLFFAKNVEHAKVHQDLYKSFKGDTVNIINSTDDGRLIIVSVTSDRNPGTYYLYNTEKNSASYLFSRADWLKSEELATVEPFKFTARDGKSIAGYLTLPNNKKDTNLPLVVNPHGGPHGPRDFWYFDWRAQVLASQGYAVLQVNFRGSGGYGDAFEESGYKEWGRKIQYDIIDATKWAIKSGIADPNRICIYGGSFGAYSAVQSSALEPDLYKCVIGASGVYDLDMLFKLGDVPESLYGTSYLNEVLGGEDHATIKEYSPVHNVQKLKAPVLIVHGSADERTPIEQAEVLEDALKQKGHKYKTLYIDNEYHGFIVPENRLKATEAIVEFLNEHIGAD